MELLVGILCIAVIGLAIKLSRISDANASLAELIDLIRRLEHRVNHLERQYLQGRDATAAVPEQQPTPPAVGTELSTPATAAAHQELSVSRRDFLVPEAIKAAAAPEASGPAQSAPTHTAPPPPPPRPISPARPPVRSISIEERLGQNWLSKIGIVLVVLGIATFLGYKLVTLGALGKSLTGFATAILLLGGGLLLERRPNYRLFARAGIGGGWALLFFITFALYHVEAMQVLTSQTADLVLMALVASAMVWHSLRYRSQVVTALAFLLAFATVGISHVTLFSLVAGAILAAALAYVAAREYWFELGLAGLCGVYLNHFLWLLRVLPGGHRGRPFPDLFASAGLLLLYWLIFRVFYILRAPQSSDQERIASITAILNSAGLLALLKYQSSKPEWTFPTLLALGAIEMALAFVARRRRRTAFLVLASLASALLLAAIPFRFAGSSWTLLWLFEAEALFVAGILLKEKALRRLGLVAGWLTALQLLFIDTLPVLGMRVLAVDTVRHAPAAIALSSVALLFWFNSEYARRRWPGLTEDPFDETALTATSYLAALAMAGAFWLVIRNDGPDNWLTIGWGALALALFESGILFRLRSVRNQGYALIAATFLRLLFYDLQLGTSGGGTGTDHRIYTVIPLIAAYIWIYQRTQTALVESASDRVAGILSAWLGTAAATALLYLELRPEFIAIAWSMLALLLITAARLLGRAIFTAQALCLLALSAGRAVAFNLFTPADPAAAFWSSRAATVGAMCAVMLCGLPMAFAIRRRPLSDSQLTNSSLTDNQLGDQPAANAAQDPWHLLLTRPEQPFFFVPYALLAILIALELRTGMITLGWIALGLAAFLAALPIGERSYRLGGLGLLLVGLAKIVLVDIWSLSTTDRILTLIVTGAALLLVSFLYSRYRETILKFL